MSSFTEPQDPSARYQALVVFSQAIRSGRGYQQILTSLFQGLRGISGFRHLSVGLYCPQENVVQLRILKENEACAPVSVAPEESPEYHVCQSRTPLIVPELDGETRYSEAFRSLRDSEIHSVCVLPLVTTRRQLGGLTMGREQAYAYPAKEVEFLSLAANEVALAIDDALNFEAGRLGNERLKMLFDLNKSIVSNLELQGLLRAGCATIRAAMDCYSAMVGLIDSENEWIEIVARAALDGPGRIYEGLRFPIDGADLRSLQTVKATAINRLEQSGLDPGILDSLASEGVRSLCYAPLIARNRTLGVLALGKTHENGFSHDDLNFLGQFAGQITVAVENGLGRLELQRHQFLLTEGQRLTRSASFRWVPSSGEVIWSLEMYRVLGCDPERTKPAFDLFMQRVHPEDRARVGSILDQATTENRRFEFEFRILLPDGTVRFAQDVGEAIRNASGELTEYIGTTVDLTERKRAEEELRRSEGRLAEGQRLTHTGTWSRNACEPFEDVWSQELFRILGLDPGVARPSWELFLSAVHPDDRIRVETTRARTFPECGDSEDEFRIVRPDNSIRYVHLCFHPVMGEAGELLEYMATVMDVTEQHHARSELGRAFDEIRMLKDKLLKENLVLRDEINRASMFEEIVGSSPVLKRVLLRAEKVAPTDSTVLITGETGTGKELIARAIHKRSQRAARPFVSVNCAALPQALIASELFGHEKGAFTGATQRRLGRFELADGGTIFLDEVGDLPMETQVALLRVLQEREFERVGGTRSIPVDVRVVVSTNRDLRSAIAAGQFRADLFYRLNVFPIEAPPLRERKEDIPLLLDYFVRHYAKVSGKKIREVEQSTLKLFQGYDWPGNVRELQNIVERSVILCTGETFSVDESWLSHGIERSARIGSTRPLAEMLLEQERKAIEAALTASNGRVAGSRGAAALLGMPQSTLAWRIKVLKIRKHQFHRD